MAKTGYISDRNPNWTQCGIPEEYYDKDFHRIMMFFVFHSPCPGRSNRMITLTDRGWKAEPWYSSSYLKEKIDEAIFSNDVKLYKMAESHKTFEEAIHSLDLEDNFYNKRDRQRFCHVKVDNAGCQSTYMSFFCHLRNMLAHARIAMYPAKNNDICLVMEDGTNVGNGDMNKFKVSGRAVILKSSLLKIIDLLESPPVEQDYTEDIMALIKKGKNTKKVIIDALKIDDRIWNFYSGKLRHNNMIEYKNKCWVIV